MERLLRYWEQNKRKIIITIAIIALVFIVIQIANAMIKEQKANNQDKVNIKSEIAKDITKPTKSIVSDKKISEDIADENQQLISKFVEYCNKKDINNAYNLLSDDCKEEVYSTNELFSNNYINKIFLKERNYELELWNETTTHYTYKIIYNEGNLLQTGGKTSNSNFIDYITVENKDKQLKLNISQFVRKEKLNKNTISNNIEMQVNSKCTYVDYEIYNITFSNNTQSTIVINDGKSIKNIYLLDENDSKYYGVISEVPISNFTIRPQYKQTINLKFNKMYMTNSKINSIKIEDIRIDDNRKETMAIKL